MNAPAAAKQAKFKGRSIISMRDLSKDELLTLIDAATQVRDAPPSRGLCGKVLAACFFEPSTRTRLSFESAMARCGGATVGFAEGKTTSASKRESLNDTMKVISQYADVIVLRHPLDGAARYAAEVCDKPLINAGDGANQHPTQTLIDLFSINETQGGLDGLHVAFTGDLRNARSIHSLVQACALFNMRMYFVPSHGFDLPAQMYDELKRQSVMFSIHTTLASVLPKIDILYMTRVQEERLSKGHGYVPASGYELELPLLAAAKATMRILHPLPRVREIDPAIDATPHAYYFNQAKNGLYVREALLRLILGDHR